MARRVAEVVAALVVEAVAPVEATVEVTVEAVAGVDLGAGHYRQPLPQRISLRFSFLLLSFVLPRLAPRLTADAYVEYAVSCRFQFPFASFPKN
jgi:hypothetical protein